MIIDNLQQISYNQITSYIEQFFIFKNRKKSSNKNKMRL